MPLTSADSAGAAKLGLGAQLAPTGFQRLTGDVKHEDLITAFNKLVDFANAQTPINAAVTTNSNTLALMTPAVYIAPQMGKAIAGTWSFGAGIYTNFSGGTTATYNSSLALNDAFSYTVFLQPGTYKTSIGFLTSSNSCIVTATIGTTAWFTQDLYNSSVTDLVVSGSIAPNTAGLYTFNFAAKAQNSSSTGYRLSAFGLYLAKQ